MLTAFVVLAVAGGTAAFVWLRVRRRRAVERAAVSRPDPRYGQLDRLRRAGL